MTPKQFIKSASRAGVFQHPKLNDAIEFASDAFVEYVTERPGMSDEEMDDAAGHITGMAMENYNLHGEEHTEAILSALFHLAAGMHESMKHEAINEDATRLVASLLDEETSQVELELNTVNVDSMPHTSWLLRAVGADPTAYVAKDIQHTHEMAMKAAQHKAMMLGVQISRVIDNSQGGHK